MHYSGSLLGGHIVAGNHAERPLVRTEPGNQLLVAHAHEVRALAASDHLVRYLVVEKGVDEVPGDDVGRRVAGIGIGGFHPHVIDVRPYAERGVGRQGPGGGGPCEEIEIVLAHGLELHGAGRVLHVAVASRLVELMAAEPGAGCGGIGLYGLAFVEQTLAVDVLEQPPQGLDVAVVVGYVGVVHVDPVAYAFGQRAPFGGIFHDLPAACAVIFLNADLPAYVLLGDAELLLHSELHRKPVGVPAGAAAHLESRLRLVAADRILDGAGHHMVYSGHSVGGRRALEENELGRTLPEFEGLLERPVLFPVLQDPVGDGHEIQSAILFECHIFC